MKGLLIKPDCRTIVEVTLEKGPNILEQVYEHLLINNGSRMVQLVNFTDLGLPWTDDLLVDEEGKLSSSANLGRFMIGPREATRKPLIFGRALVLRTNKHGRFVSPKLRFDVLQSYVEWDRKKPTQKLFHYSGERA